MVKLLLDTNIFIYHFLENPSFVKYTDFLFKNLEKGKFTAIASIISIIEIFTGLKIAGDAALIKEYRDILFNFPNLKIVDTNHDLVDKTSDISSQFKIRIPDSIIIATGIHYGCNYFITNDERLIKKFSGITPVVLSKVMNLEKNENF